MYHIQMVTGKGGVGKSFVAALLASKLAREGHKTLLVEMGPWSFLEKPLGLTPRKSLFLPLKTPFGFDHAVWTGEDCLTDYVKHLIKVPWAAEAFLKNAWLRSLIKVAPGLQEISFLGKLTSQVRRHGPPLNYDCLVVDAVSSGHYLNLLKTPAGLMNITQVGPLREQSQSIHQVISDPQQFHTLVVSNLETFSVQESLELQMQLSKAVSSQMSFVANKIYPIPPSQGVASLDPKVRQFVQQQTELKAFQDLQIKKLNAKVSVEFFFEPLKDILKNDHSEIFARL